MQPYSFAAKCFLLGTLLASSAVAAPPATQPSGTPDPDARRLTFIGDQLSADEAAIAAINKALLQAGYKAVVASHNADDATRGNELMDRNGGAPVPWQDFYGRTAKDFIMHDKYSPVYHQIARPQQMDYVYHANDNLIATAKAEVDTLGKKIDLLLARRKQLESEQSSLWATLAFESITNRDIALRGLYRDLLKATPSKDNDNRPDGARTAALASAILYMRTTDHAITFLSDKLETDQSSVYASLRDTLAQAQDALKESAAVFADTPAVDPVEARQMMDVVNQAKRIQSLCKDACDAYKKAQDADAAQEEGRKLLYRRTLQDSLFNFTEETATLDTTLAKMSEAWDIRPQQGVKSTDRPLSVVSAVGGSPARPLDPASPSGAAGASPGISEHRTIDLLRLPGNPPNIVSGKWNITEARVACEPSGDARIDFAYTPPEEYDYRVTFIRTENNRSIGVICAAAGTQFSCNIGGGGNALVGFESIDSQALENEKQTVRKASGWVVNQKPTAVLIKVRKSGAEIDLNGQMITSYNRYQDLKLPKWLKLSSPSRLGIDVYNSAATVESAEVTEIGGPGKPGIP